MKNRKFFALIGIFALGGALYAGAQDYDDIYYDASKTAKKETVKKSSGSVSLTEQTQPTTVQTRVGKSTVTPVSTTPRVKVERDGYRDDDEYNRRGDYELTNPYDTTAYDDEGSFSNTQRIERFYNPEIIKGSDDEELITLYYEDQPTVNLIIGSNWGPSYWSGWGWSNIYYSPWYGGLMCDYYPWYTGWYPSWYYSWHYGWHHGLYGWGYWDSWAYRPWGYYSYHHPWNHWGYGWGRDVWRHNHGGMGHAGGRRPSSIGRGYGYNKGGNGVSGVRSNGNGIGRRPSTGGIINNDRPTSRPGVRYGSANGNYGGGGGSGTVGGHRNPSRGNVGTSSGINRSTQSSGGRSYTPSRSYGGSSSSSSGRSYGGSSSSSGRSYGGSSNIGGGRSSGGYSGGHSSGGSHSSGGHSGGGGGHRR